MEGGVLGVYQMDRFFRPATSWRSDRGTCSEFEGAVAVPEASDGVFPVLVSDDYHTRPLKRDVWLTDML
jgi:hypothetical protein